MKFFLLKGEHVLGNDHLKIFDNGYLMVEPTSYAISRRIIGDELNNTKVPKWWLNSDKNVLFGSVCNPANNCKKIVRLTLDEYGIRPATNFIEMIPFISRITDINEDVMEVEFGIYPQTFLSDEAQKYTNKLFREGQLKNIGNGIFQKDNVYYTRSSENGLWSVFEPLRWVVDKTTGIAVTKKIIDVGKRDYKGVKHFLENEFPYILSLQFKAPSDVIEEYHSLQEQKAIIDHRLKQLESDYLILNRKKH